MEHNIIVGPLTVSAGMMANHNTGLDHNFRLYPGIDISYRPGSRWKLFAGWNKSLRLPTYTDLYTHNAAQQGDPNLNPERNSAFKVGVHYHTMGFETTMSGFYSHCTDMIDWVYETDASTRYQAMNIGKLNNMGINITARMIVYATLRNLKS